MRIQNDFQEMMRAMINRALLVKQAENQFAEQPCGLLGVWGGWGLFGCYQTDATLPTQAVDALD